MQMPAYKGGQRQFGGAGDSCQQRAQAYKFMSCRRRIEKSANGKHGVTEGRSGFVSGLCRADFELLLSGSKAGIFSPATSASARISAKLRKADFGPDGEISGKYGGVRGQKHPHYGNAFAEAREMESIENNIRGVPRLPAKMAT